VAVKKMVLVRHGVTDWNASGLFQGQADVPLNARGQAQAARSAQAIAALKPTRIISSDSARAFQTATAIAEATGLKVLKDERLREVDVGTWSGMSVDEVAQISPTFARAMQLGEDFRRSPTGETGTEAGARVARALRDFSIQYDDECLVVVGHGMSLKVGAFELMGLNYRASRLFSTMENAGWMVVLPGKPWRMRAYNQLPIQGLVGQDDKEQEI
jgi:probable phosphoglycerate mutase